VTFELLAVFVAGICGVTAAMVLRKITRDAAPRWLMGAFGGLAMIAMSIWNEYSWSPRLLDGMTEEQVVAQTIANPSAFRPWSYVFPMVDTALVIDRRQNRTHPQKADLVITPVYRLERWSTTRNVVVAFDCGASRRVDLTPDITFSDSGELQGGTWVQVSSDDPVLRAACDGG
jgi:hypothetical protein